MNDLTDSFASEVVGQLYAYRLSASTAVLRTRVSMDLMNNSVAIGIQTIADGEYSCVAENANLQTNLTFTIQTESK